MRTKLGYLRYIYIYGLATGCSYATLSDVFGVSASSASMFSEAATGGVL